MSFFFFLFAIYYSPVSSAKHLIYQHNIFIFWPRRSGCVWSPLLESLPKTGFCSKSSVWWDWLHLGVRALWLASASPPDSFFAFSYPSANLPKLLQTRSSLATMLGSSCTAHARVPCLLHQNYSWFEKCLGPPELLILGLKWRIRFCFSLPFPAERTCLTTHHVDIQNIQVFHQCNSFLSHQWNSFRHG